MVVQSSTGNASPSWEINVKSDMCLLCFFTIPRPNYIVNLNILVSIFTSQNSEGRDGAIQGERLKSPDC